MPKITPEVNSLNSLATSQREVIINKAQFRTSLLRELSFSKPEDTRDPAVLEYEAKHYDNPTSPFYEDDDAAMMYAMLKNLGDVEWKTSTAKSVTLRIGLTIVPVNSRFHDWDDDVVNKPFICVAPSRQLFRGADGKEQTIAINTLNCRPATDDEITAVVDGLLAVRPAQTIKTLGELTFEGSDD